MHDDLTTFDTAVGRIAHDSLVHLVRQAGRSPAIVRVAVPKDWDADAFGAALAEVYADRGMDGVEVMTVSRSGEPRLLAVVPR